MVRLRVLGGIDLRDDAGREFRPVLAQSKRFAILCYLAIAPPRTFHRRDTLIGLFWPEADDEHARSALRQALHFLRHAVGENILASRGDDEIGVAPGSLWCDAVAFEEALTAGSDAEAADLYGGDLLPGFFISEAPEFDRWMDGERMRLRECVSTVLERLASTAAADGDHRGSIRQWRRLATMDPLNSRVAVGLMTSIAAAGDRAGAIRHADAHAALIRDELGGEADEAVMALAKQFRSAEFGRHAAEPPTAAQQIGVSPAAELAEASVIAAPGPASALPRRRKGLRVGIGTLAVVSGLGLAIAGVLVGRGNGATLNPRRIAVAVLDNRTDDSALTSLGRMASDWITQGLSRTELVEVVPATTALSAGWRWDANTGAYLRASDRELARRTGAGLLVAGSYYRTGDSLQFRVEVTDVIKDHLIGGPLMIGVPVSASLRGVELLRQQVMGALAVGLNAEFDRWARVTAHPPSFEAYQEFMTGQEIALENGPLRVAVEHWRRAATIDSGYTQAWLSLVNGLGELGDSAEANSAAQRLELRRGRLTPVERIQLDHVQAQLHGDSYARLEAARRIVALTPGSCWLITLGTDAHFSYRPREAIEALRQLDPEATCVRKDRDYWTALAMSLHLLGDYEGAVRAARRGRAQHPLEYQVIFAELGALSALGRADEANRLIQQSMSLPAGARRMPDQIKYDASDLMGIAASELRAHGHVVEAQHLYGRLIRWLESRPQAERATEAPRSVLARRLYEAGRYEDSRAGFDSLAREYPEKYLYRAYVGVLAARRRDREQAMQADAWLARALKVRPRGSHTIWRARIASLLGEKERAVSLIHEAIGQGYTRRYYLHWREDFEGLRGYQPFEEAIRPQG
jgi:DNA-binding SARP family transcriptional activator/tetratricopeptide (TPR) repeat protein